MLGPRGRCEEQPKQPDMRRMQSIDKTCWLLHMTTVPHAMLQVRALCPIASGFATASRDRTGKIWAESSAHAFQNTMTLVNIVVPLP